MLMGIFSLPHQPSPSPSVFSSVALIHHEPPPPPPRGKSISQRQSAGRVQTRNFESSRRLALIPPVPNQNARARSVLKTGRSRLGRPDRNRPSAPRRNQEVLQSKHAGEKSVDAAAWPRRGCARGKVNSTG